MVQHRVSELGCGEVSAGEAFLEKMGGGRSWKMSAVRSRDEECVLQERCGEGKSRR